MKNPNSGRFLLVEVILLFFGFFILARIFRIQHSAEAKALLEGSGPLTLRTFYPARGEILDRDGHLLAGNKIVYEIGVSIASLEKNNNAETIALASSYYLGTDYQTVFDCLTHPASNQTFIVLSNFASPDVKQKFEDLKIASENKPGNQTLAGLEFTPRTMRSYPEGSLASNVIGFVTQEGFGYYGVEEKFNSLLAGTTINAWISMDPNKPDLPDIPPGATLVLTLNRELQAVVEEILDNALQNTGAESGTIIVIQPKTGEVLAMVTTPRMNLNEYWRVSEIFPGETPFNRAITQAYEPGSVFKVLTMASALDAGAVRPEDTYFDNGLNLYGGVPIYNWNNTAWGLQDMTGCLQHSINTCLVHVADLLGKENFYSYMKKFGIGHTTGIDLAGEASGRLRLPDGGDWHQVDLATNAFGQGVSVTPIQMAMAASAIANDGNMMYPHLVRAIIQDGRQQNINPQVIGMPISTATAHTLNEMLSTSLEQESSNALVPGYRVSGKTGTAQIPVPGVGYDSTSTNASFVGWGPVDDPQFLVYVWLERPTSSIWGSEVAAPLFKQIVEKFVVLMGIPPDNIRLQKAPP